MLEATSISERRACALVGLSRDSWRHPPQRAQNDQATSQRIVELAYERRRFGYRHIGDPKERGVLVARVYLNHPDGECDAACAVLATLAAQVAAAPVLIAALRQAVGSGSLPPEVAQAARDALAAAGG